jgi:hypothetical protein
MCTFVSWAQRNFLYVVSIKLPILKYVTRVSPEIGHINTRVIWLNPMPVTLMCLFYLVSMVYSYFTVSFGDVHRLHSFLPSFRLSTDHWFESTVLYDMCLKVNKIPQFVAKIERMLVLNRLGKYIDIKAVTQHILPHNICHETLNYCWLFRAYY